MPVCPFLFAGLQALSLRTDNSGRWSLADGTTRPDLDGCLDIDIWPTPFTNSFPIHREALSIGERRTFRMAWVSGGDRSRSGDRCLDCAR